MDSLDELFRAIEHKKWRWVMRNRGVTDDVMHPPGKYFAHVFEEESGLDWEGRFNLSGASWSDTPLSALRTAYMIVADNEAERSGSS